MYGHFASVFSSSTLAPVILLVTNCVFSYVCKFGSAGPLEAPLAAPLTRAALKGNNTGAIRTNLINVTISEESYNLTKL